MYKALPIYPHFQALPLAPFLTNFFHACEVYKIYAREKVRNREGEHGDKTITHQSKEQGSICVCPIHMQVLLADGAAPGEFDKLQQLASEY